MSDEDENTERNEVHIKVDNKATEKLVEMLQNEKLEKEAKELQAEDLAEKIKQANEEYNTDMFNQATSTDQLKVMIRMHVQDLVKMTSKNDHPSGSAPLNDAQYGNRTEDNYDGDLMKRPFKSKEDMIQYLHSQHTQEAKEGLDRLWQAYIRGWKEMGRPSTVYPPVDQPTKGTPEVILNNPEVNDETDSELKRWGIKKTPMNYSKRKNEDGSEK